MFYLSNILLFLGSALTLLMPSGYLVLGMSFMVMGFLCLILKRHQVSTLKTPSVYWMVGGFWLYSLIGVLMVLFHGHVWSYYEMYLPAILYPLIFFSIARTRISPLFFFLGAATGAIGAALVAIYQARYLGVSRANGIYFNAIHFGNTGLVLGTASLIALIRLPVDQFKWPIRVWLATGGICGMLTSLLSGSKGGWGSLIMVLLLVSFFVTQHWPMVKRLTVVSTVLTVLITGASLLPKDTVVGRIENGIQGAKVWLSTGQVTEGSVSVRLAAWKTGVDMFIDRPWTGWGGLQMGPEKFRRLEQTGLEVHYNQGLGAFENEYINAIVRFGLMGAVQLLLVFAGPLLAFSRFRHHPDKAIQTFTMLGMLLPLMYMEFGLSVSVLSVNTCRQVYFAWCIVLLSLILQRLHHVKTHPVLADSV